jgi:hypothetical protein
MSIARLSQRFKRALNKAARIWRETSDRSFTSRVVNLSQRILTSARWRIHSSWAEVALTWRSSSGNILPSMRGRMRNLLRFTYRFLYDISTRAIYPLNYVLSIVRKNIKYQNSVLHISYMVHIPYYTVRILRRQNMKADYLALGGKSPWWDKYDYHFPPTWPPSPWEEFFFSGRSSRSMRLFIPTLASCSLPLAGSCPI